MEEIIETGLRRWSLVEKLSDQDLMEKALYICLQAHQGQKDLGRQPYVLHPLYLVSRVSSLRAKIVAALHDTIEDGLVTLDYLRQQGFDEEIIDAVDRLTRRSDESDMDYCYRILGAVLALEVKWYDLLHNRDTSRLPKLTPGALRRLERYEEMKAVLQPHWETHCHKTGIPYTEV